MRGAEVIRALVACAIVGALLGLTGCVTPERQAALLRIQMTTCAIVDELSMDVELELTEKLERARRACRVASIAAAVAAPANASEAEPSE